MLTFKAQGKYKSNKKIEREEETFLEVVVIEI